MSVTRFAPILPALAIAGLIAASWIEHGTISPVTPQAVADRGYRELWSGYTDGPQGAVALFRQALLADPAFPYRWSDLGGALATSGRTDFADYCFRRGVFLAPNSPQIGVRAANFYFQQGETIPALALTAAVLRITPAYDNLVFNSWVRLGGDLNSILEHGVGNNRRAAEAFFRYLVTSNGDLAAPAWKWMEARSYATPALAIVWSDWLISHRRDAEASAVWQRHVARDSSWGRTNRIDNSGFENEPANAGFDWRFLTCPGVVATIDSGAAHSGGASLRLDFDGSGNIDFHHVVQHVWMPPGRYRLTAWVRTAGLTTDQGVSLALNDVSTEALTGTNDWTEVSAYLTIRTAMASEVRIVRRPSLRFDSKPKGSVWIDDVELRRSD